MKPIYSEIYQHSNRKFDNCLQALPEASHHPCWGISKVPCPHGLFSSIQDQAVTPPLLGSLIRPNYQLPNLKQSVKA